MTRYYNKTQDYYFKGEFDSRYNAEDEIIGFEFLRDKKNKTQKENSILEGFNTKELEEIREKKIEEIDQTRDSSLPSEITIEKGTFQVDGQSRRNLIDSMVVEMAGIMNHLNPALMQSTKSKWITKDNKEVELSLADKLQIVVQSFTLISEEYHRARSLKDDVKTKTKEELETFNIKL